MIVRKEAFKRFLKRLTGAESQPSSLEQAPPPEPASWREEPSEQTSGPESARSEEDTLARR